jgi:hypothetical protein
MRPADAISATNLYLMMRYCGGLGKLIRQNRFAHSGGEVRKCNLLNPLVERTHNTQRLYL